MKLTKWLIFPVIFAGMCVPAGAQTKGTVLEEIVARVNNDIITREDLEHARAALEGEVRDSCANCSEDKIRTLIAAKDKDLLRDLIDQSLLTQRAKDDGINVDAEVIKRMDAIRQQNKLPDMDALEKAVTSSGQDFEDFKGQLRDQLL